MSYAERREPTDVVAHELGRQLYARRVQEERDTWRQTRRRREVHITENEVVLVEEEVIYEGGF